MGMRYRKLAEAGKMAGPRGRPQQRQDGREFKNFKEVESLQRLSVHRIDCKWDNGVSFISLAMDRMQINGFTIDQCI